MKSDNAGNATASDATSTKRPADNESDFLTIQAQEARDAMSRALHDMADALKDSADPRAWTREHPIASLGAATVLGFFMASALTPSREETIKDRLAALFPHAPAEPEPDGHPQAAPPRHSRKKEKSSTLANLLRPALNALKPALISAVSSAVTGKMQKDAVQEAAQGHGDNPTPRDPDVNTTTTVYVDDPSM